MFTVSLVKVLARRKQRGIHADKCCLKPDTRRTNTQIETARVFITGLPLDREEVVTNVHALRWENLYVPKKQCPNLVRRTPNGRCRRNHLWPDFLPIHFPRAQLVYCSLV